MADDGIFAVQLPMWTVVDVKEFKGRGADGSVAMVRFPESNTRAFPLFTGAALVKAFVKKMGALGKTPLELKTSDALRTLLQAYQDRGTNDIAIDLKVAANGSLRGQVGPLQEILDGLSQLTLKGKA